MSFILIILLCSDDFKTREWAQKQLEMNPPIQILQITQYSKNLELAQRSRIIVKKHLLREREKLIRSMTKYPWIGNHNGFYLKLARMEIGMQGPPDWADYRLATKLMLSVEIELDAKTVLNELWEQERNWVNLYGHRFDPKIVFDLPP